MTRILRDVDSGKRSPSDELLPLVYEKLRAIARQRMARERPGHTLQATALVHEAYARLIKPGDQQWGGSGHFFAAAGEAMRRILIEHARARGSVKRGGGRERRRVPLNVVDLAATEDSEQIMVLDEAFSRMEVQEPEMAAVVRLRFFAGLSVEQTAEALGVSPTTVKRRWTWARAWLFREIHGDEERT